MGFDSRVVTPDSINSSENLDIVDFDTQNNEDLFESTQILMGPTQNIGEVESEPNSEVENAVSTGNNSQPEPNNSSKENLEDSNLEQNSDMKNDETADTTVFSEEEGDLLFDLDDPQPEHSDALAPTQK